MGRLFWKILFGFWLTLIVVTLTVNAVANHYNESRLRASSEVALGGRVAMMTTAAAASLRHGGPPALQALFDGWPRFARDRLLVVDAHDRDLFDRPVPPPALAEARRVLRDGLVDNQSVISVDTPQGEVLFFVLADNMPHRGPPPPRGVPGFMLLWFGVGSLAFSAVLAWYLTRPIRVLKQAFDRVSEGDLSVRVGPRIGSRRDEIADLGRDFDIMTGRLAQLVASQKQLLHDVSHELRSPLARLQVAVGLARQQPEKIAPTLERIEREVHRLDTMVGELLTLSRLEAGAQQEWDDYFDPIELAEEVVADATFEAAASEVRIGLLRDATPEEGVVVHGRAELLHRALENIVRNAVRYSQGGQLVSVAVRQPDAAHCVIEVMDQGPGVPEEQLQRIFEPFIRVGEQSSGYGLGLAIAQRAVQAHGGTIAAANRPEGGLVITLTLPLVPTGQAA
ncbi:two-component system, OmpR family, sensor kinase [Andreprevotia lacus DSM 23236]|jgi:two-component system OmpR family sensor kinase|uniref:histidine kinase n=1 Tax=Andreprevotia lacus DSM 23236 TaxID=1121001 RepID=A0A1W1X9W2_9NEIS|nr:ATP-binding protein [Andreprevotia lacus]SMC20617.1 two-component system, OmpR family, sensor kinase [Andreprevotia lacus DSM 23236]